MSNYNRADAAREEPNMSDEACSCGHAVEEHGHDPKHPSSTACTECDCIAYEAEDADGETKSD